MIIGVSGKMGSGKSTFAGHLAKIFNAPVMHFATPIREELAKLGIPMHLMESQEGKASIFEFDGRSATVREHMIRYAAEKRAEDPLYFVKLLHHKSGFSMLTIVDDVRYVEEARWVAERGLTIRIEHHSAETPDIESEVALDEWPHFDYVISPNFGELGDFAFAIGRQIAPTVATFWQSGVSMYLKNSVEII